MLRIDSPGGSTFASEVIRREVAELRAAGKPVVASMSTLAASGGYYIAMDADRIVASPATLTGSIGIFAMFPTFQRSLERVGVHFDGVGTTALSGEFSPVRPMGEQTRDILQQSIEHEYQRFIGMVAKSRKQDVAAIDAIAQGRVWSGADAKRLGLVDELGDSRTAIELAAKLANLGEDYDVEYLRRRVGPGRGAGPAAAGAPGAGAGAAGAAVDAAAAAAQPAAGGGRAEPHCPAQRSAQHLHVLPRLHDRIARHARAQAATNPCQVFM